MTKAPEMIPAPEGFTIDLPWPPKELSPNARVHWRKRHKHAKAYRLACGLITKVARVQAPDGMLYFWVTFFPPNRRKLDDDNLIGRMKAGRDGVADGLGIDDARFMTTVNIGDPIPGGSVRVHIRGQIQG